MKDFKEGFMYILMFSILLNNAVPYGPVYGGVYNSKAECKIALTEIMTYTFPNYKLSKASCNKIK